MADLTEWMCPNVKPVRAGWYETYLLVGQERFAYWDGTNWLWRPEDYACLMQNRYWRGLTKPSSK